MCFALALALATRARTARARTPLACTALACTALVVALPVNVEAQPEPIIRDSNGKLDGRVSGSDLEAQQSVTNAPVRSGRARLDSVGFIVLDFVPRWSYTRGRVGVRHGHSVVVGVGQFVASVRPRRFGSSCPTDPKAAVIVLVTPNIHKATFVHASYTRRKRVANASRHSIIDERAVVVAQVQDPLRPTPARRERVLMPFKPVLEHAASYTTAAIHFDFDVAFPVTVAPMTSGRVVASAVPAGTVAVAVHEGEYDTIAQSWTALDT